MKYFTILILICFLSSCNSDSGYDALSTSYKNESSSYEQDEAQSDGLADDFEIIERKIIKTAEIRFQVNDLKVSSKKIEVLTEKYAGLIANMNQTNSNYSVNNYLTIRIPSEKLETFLAEIETESIYTDYTRIHSQDVTEEYFDISTRLSTKKEVRDRYIDILRNKAKTVTDILEAEEKIRIIQEEIEATEGRLNFLKNKTSMSTIDIEIYQEVEYVKSRQFYKKPFFSKVKEGFENGWELIQDIAIGLISIWPIILIFVSLFLMRKRIRRIVKK